MSDHDALKTLAEAAIYVDDLARGLVGEFVIFGGASDEQSPQEAIAEIHRCQAVLVANGWRRDKWEEMLAPFSHNIEVACYRKQFKPGQQSRWIVVTVAIRFGILAKFEGKSSLW